MIVRSRPGALRLLFALRGSIFPKISRQLAVVFLIACAVVLFYESGHGEWLRQLSPTSFSLLGLALSVFLGFRNSTCYDRWWEARKRWGDVLIQCRSLARTSLALLDGEERETARRLLYRSIGFAHAMAAQLRGEAVLPVLARWVSEQELHDLVNRSNPSQSLLGYSSRDLAGLLRGGRLGEVQHQMLERHLHELTTAQAACERIQGTPTPFAYSLLLHRSAWMFCLLLPFGLVSSLEGLTPLLVSLIAYAFFGLDALGDELEEPFGLSDNDLPLNAIVRRIEIDLLDLLGEPTPEPLRPVDYLLT